MGEELKLYPISSSFNKKENDQIQDGKNQRRKMPEPDAVCCE